MTLGIRTFLCAAMSVAPLPALATTIPLEGGSIVVEEGDDTDSDPSNDNDLGVAGPYQISPETGGLTLAPSDSVTFDIRTRKKVGDTRRIIIKDFTFGDESYFFEITGNNIQLFTYTFTLIGETGTAIISGTYDRDDQDSARSATVHDDVDLIGGSETISRFQLLVTNSSVQSLEIETVSVGVDSDDVFVTPLPAPAGLLAASLVAIAGAARRRNARLSAG